jgi:hypothetical protein
VLALVTRLHVAGAFTNVSVCSIIDHRLRFCFVSLRFARQQIKNFARAKQQKLKFEKRFELLVMTVSVLRTIPTASLIDDWLLHCRSMARQVTSDERRMTVETQLFLSGVCAFVGRDGKTLNKTYNPRNDT